jgi:ATP-dependent protease HslVU (ClpYQ) peptidase subunit
MLQAEANRDAQRIEEDGNRFAHKQKLMYIGSGVEYGGSAVVTIMQTKKWAAAEASAKRARGAAISQYGYQTARIQEGQGRAALVGGYAGAALKVSQLGEQITKAMLPGA